MNHSDLEVRLEHLERRLRRGRALTAGAVVALVSVLGLASTPNQDPIQDRIRARRIEVVDDQGRTRIVMAQDPKDTERRSRSVGINLYDANGAERFGVGVMEDRSVVLGLDAPVGVGSPMRDRLALTVGANGSASVMLLDNATKVPVRLVATESGGGVEFIAYGEDKVKIKRISFAGENVREIDRGK